MTWANAVDAFFGWNGWGAVGTVLTLLGLLLTIVLAYRAKKSADEAAVAVRNATQTFARVDAVAELSRLIEFLKLIRTRLSFNDWGRISEICDDMQVSIAKLETSKSIALSASSREKISDLRNRIGVLGGDCDKAMHKGTKVDAAKQLSVVSSLSGDLSALHTELRESVGTHDT